MTTPRFDSTTNLTVESKDMMCPTGFLLIYLDSEEDLHVVLQEWTVDKHRMSRSGIRAHHTDQQLRVQCRIQTELKSIVMVALGLHHAWRFVVKLLDVSWGDIHISW